jgi:hypothetical protein
VSISPGAIAFTLASGARTLAKDLVTEMTPALEAQYAIELPLPVIPATDAMLITLPLPCFFITGVTARQQKNTPEFTAKISSGFLFIASGWRDQ